MSTDEHRAEGHWIAYHAPWDAMWCVTCGVWTEKTCGDEECMFCAARPTHPSWGTSGPVVTSSTNFTFTSKP